MSVAQLKVYIYLCACYQGQPFSAAIPQLNAVTGLAQRSVIAATKLLRQKKLISRIAGKGNQPNQYSILLPKRPEIAAPSTSDTTPPSPRLIQDTPPSATPTQATQPELITALPSTKSGQVTAPAATLERATTPELSIVPPTAKSGQVTAPAATPTPATTQEHIPALPNPRSDLLAPPATTPAQATVAKLIAAEYRLLTDQELVYVLDRYKNNEVGLLERLGRMKMRGGADIRMSFSYFIRDLDRA